MMADEPGAPTLSPDRADQNFLRDVITGLSQPRRAIPGKYLWDETGSILFDRIGSSPDYYLTRREIGLLGQVAGEIAEVVGENAVLVEFGSGASHKVRILLDHLHACRRYVAVDISQEYLEAAAARIAADYPDLDVVPVHGDYTQPIVLPASAQDGPVLGFFPGNTIGNFDASGVIGFLHRVQQALGPSWFLLGIDPNDDRDRLLRAYGGDGSLLAQFHENLLTRLARDLGAELSLKDFRHQARVIDDPLHVEAHLVAQRDTVIRIGPHSFPFAAGESIHTDNSFKYTPDAFGRLASQAGWRPVHCWTDKETLFSLHLLRFD